MKKYKSLVINPGATSTKIGVFEGTDRCCLKRPYVILRRNCTPYPDILDQFDFRKGTILEAIGEEKFDIRDIDFIMARGGVLKPMPSGVYRVNGKMLEDLRLSESRHASNLAAIIAFSLSESLAGCLPLLPTRWWWTKWMMWREYLVTGTSYANRFSMRSTRKLLPNVMPGIFQNLTRNSIS